ncbi:MAG: M48 family metalloprotease [Thermoanaerobaculia bacterium]
MHRIVNSAVRAAIVLVVGLGMAAPVAEAQTKIKTGFNLFSASQDVEVGTASAAEVEKQLPLVTDRAVVAYVDEIGQRLAAKAGGPGFKYQFGVINASDINAFALPGGFVFINRGIVEGARNEGELAGVLAHEIAHVSLRHGTHQASKAYGAQAGLSILGGLLGDRVGDSTAGIINAVGGFGMNALFLKFSRELETQSDIRGAQILAAAGYTPADMVSFFQMLEKTDTARKTSWLSSHPAPPDRVTRIQREAQLLRVSTQPTQRVTELNGIKSRLQRLGSAPTMAQIAAGQTSGSTAPTQTVAGVAPPSTRLRSFTSDSRAYRVSYPEDWQVHKQGSTGVVFAPAGGITQTGGRTEIVHGVIVNHYEPFGNISSSKTMSYIGDTTVEDATADLIEQIMKGDPHLKVVKNSRRQLDLISGPALSAILRGVNPRTRVNERLTVVTHQLDDDNLIYLLFAAPENDAKSYAPTLNAMVKSIQFDDDFTN